MASAFLIGSLAFTFLNTTKQSVPHTGQPEKSTVGDYPSRLEAAYGQMEMSFEPNHGQTDPSVGFLARGMGYALFLKPDEAVFSLSGNEDIESSDHDPIGELPVFVSKAGPSARRAVPPSVLRLKLLGADPNAEAASSDELAGKTNYFIGNDPANWRTDVPTYGRVRYSNVYNGIDVEYYGNQRQLEYDFRVEPGADYRQIKMDFDGARSVKIEEATGDLLIDVKGGILRQLKPFIYQDHSGSRAQIEGSFHISDSGQVGFDIADYDPTRPLIIDPVLVYSTYLGGTNGDEALDITIDSAGALYITGLTRSPNFPTVNPIQPAIAPDPFYGDIFVLKLNSAGSAIVYSTFLGGDRFDEGRKIALDPSGNIYITGYTDSSNFPTVNAIKPIGAGYEAFLAKLSPSGSQLLFSTHHGGSGTDLASGLAIDVAGNVYVAGFTASSNFPVTAGAYRTERTGTNGDAFITKFDPTGSVIIFSTLFGSDANEYLGAIAIDADGYVYITGTSPPGLPTVNAIQGTFGGGTDDAYVAKFNPSGTALVYSTYLGGSSGDSGIDLVVDPAGNVFVAGLTRSPNFPTMNPIQSAAAGIGSQSDAFVLKINVTGTALVYSTYIGGTGGDEANSIVIDADGNAYVAGGSNSTNFPRVQPLQAAYGGGNSDAFVLKVNAAGSAWLYSSQLGGTNTDSAQGVTLDTLGNAYLTGYTQSINFPLVAPLQATKSNGLRSVFLAKIGDVDGPPPSPVPTPTPTPTPPPPPSTPLPYLGSIVISQVYGQGGTPGAVYRNNYVEVFNRSSSPVHTHSLNVALGLGTGAIDRSFGGFGGSNGNWIQPGQYLLFQMGSGGSNGAVLPTPDAVLDPSFPTSYFGSSAKIALTGENWNNSIFAVCPLSAQGLLDFVGIGNINCYEGFGPVTGLTASVAALRKNNGCTDTDNNAADFVLGSPNPRNTSSPFNACSGPPTPTPTPTPTPIPTPTPTPSPLPNINVSGRVVTPAGLGLRGALVRLTDKNGNSSNVSTGSLGYFFFGNVPAGEVSIFVSSRRYRFEQGAFNLFSSTVLPDMIGME